MVRHGFLPHAACLALDALLATAPTLAHAQGGSPFVDSVRGRVTGQDSVPIENANITVTTVSGALGKTARTDGTGHYTLAMPSAEGR